MVKDKTLKPKPDNDDEEIEDRGSDLVALIGGIVVALALVAMIVMLVLALIPR